jgi:hypothetical protein
MILSLSTTVIFKDAVVSPEIKFFKRVIERFFDFFKAEGYPGMVIPYKWELYKHNWDTGIYVDAGKIIWVAEGWQVDCEFIEREPFKMPGFKHTHTMVIEHPQNHIHFKLVYHHGDEIPTGLWAEVNMPPALESRFIAFMQEN